MAKLLETGGKIGSGGNDVSLIFVYGTLKQGFYNHRLIEDLIQIGNATYLGPHTTVEAFPLVCGPHGIPFLVNLPGSGLRVRGELYSVSAGPGQDRLDELEGIEQGHYERLRVAVVDVGERVVEVEAYFAHRAFGEALWKRCGEVGLSEYSMELGKMYVRKQDRPPHSSFLEDMHKFISEAN